jgi:hypothetical protein
MNKSRGRPNFISTHTIVAMDLIYFPWSRTAAGTATTIAGIDAKLNHRISGDEGALCLQAAVSLYAKHQVHLHIYQHARSSVLSEVNTVNVGRKKRLLCRAPLYLRNARQICLRHRRKRTKWLSADYTEGTRTLCCLATACCNTRRGVEYQRPAVRRHHTSHID